MSKKWTTVCKQEDLIPGSGVCALFEGEQVAVFREALQDTLYAVSNYDPIGEANVLSRGIIGSIGGELVVASPLYKQHFCLATGRCVEDENHKLKTFPVRVQDGEVQLSHH